MPRYRKRRGRARRKRRKRRTGKGGKLAQVAKEVRKLSRAVRKGHLYDNNLVVPLAPMNLVSSQTHLIAQGDAEYQREGDTLLIKSMVFNFHIKHYGYNVVTPPQPYQTIFIACVRRKQSVLVPTLPVWADIHTNSNWYDPVSTNPVKKARWELLWKRAYTVGQKLVDQTSSRIQPIDKYPYAKTFTSPMIFNKKVACQGVGAALADFNKGAIFLMYATDEPGAWLPQISVAQTVTFECPG